MDGIAELQKSLDRATGELRRAREAYSTCLLNDPGGCAAEQQAVAEAERRVQALRRNIDEARMRATLSKEKERRS